VRVDGDGFTAVQQRRGDSTDLMLDYVGYDLADDLRAAYKRQDRTCGNVDAAFAARNRWPISKPD
jgi:arginine decarboxylase